MLLPWVIASFLAGFLVALFAVVKRMNATCDRCEQALNHYQRNDSDWWKRGEPEELYHTEDDDDE